MESNNNITDKLILFVWYLDCKYSPFSIFAVYIRLRITFRSIPFRILYVVVFALSHLALYPRQCRNVFWQNVHSKL